MPHVIVKLWHGKLDDEKRHFADAITREVTRILGYGDEAVSVALEEVAPRNGTGQLYNPDILGKWGQPVKEPGYGARPGAAARPPAAVPE